MAMAAVGSSLSWGYFTVFASFYPALLGFIRVVQSVYHRVLKGLGFEGFEALGTRGLKF